MPKSILVHVASKGSFPCLEALIKKLLLKKFRLVFCFDFLDDELSKRASLFGGKIIFFEEEVEKTSKKNEFKIKFMRKAPFFKVPDHEFSSYHYRRLMASKYILKKYKPALVLVAEDGITGNYWLLNAARHLRIPILDTPYSFGSYRDLENSLAIKKRQDEVLLASSDLKNTERYAHWIKKGKFSGAIMFPEQYIICLEALGITIPNPWTIHGGVANKIAVESDRMYQHYLDEGVPKEKLSLTGVIYCDQMYSAINSEKEYKQAFENSTPIKTKKTSALVCWPPNFDSERKSEFESYLTLTKSIMCYLASLPDLEVTVSLHPSVEVGIKKEIENSGVKVSSENVFELIPKHDLYISCFSSTIRYAIACAKPVINYDLYQFNLIDYADEPAVCLVKTFDEFKYCLNSFMGTPYYKKMALLQKKASAKWGVVDGNNFTRLYNLVEQMA